MLSHGRTNEYGQISEQSTGLARDRVAPDNLIPVLSIFTGWTCCAEMISLNPRPSEWSVGSTCNCHPACCIPNPFYEQSCIGLKLSDVQGECCLLCEVSARSIVPLTCYSCNGDLLFLNCRYTLPKESDFDHASIPCVCNIAGCNICIDGNFRCGFFQSIKTLREGEWICPACPCVLGSLNNCKILCDCLGACSELCSVMCAPKPAPKNQSLELVPTTEEGAERATGPLKAEVMARDAANFAATKGMEELRKLGNRGKDQHGKTRARDLYPDLGLCCCISSFYTKVPDCLGSFCENTLLCFSCSCTHNKPMVQRGEVFTGDVFLCVAYRIGCVWPRTLLSCIGQFFCRDIRCALPCDGQDVPCLFNICFVNCCYNWRPTFHCTWFAPLAQFTKEYEGEKYTVGRMLCIGLRFIGSKIASCKNVEPVKKIDGGAVKVETEKVDANAK